MKRGSKTGKGTRKPKGSREKLQCLAHFINCGKPMENNNPKTKNLGRKR